MMLLAQTATVTSKALQFPDYLLLVGYFVLMLGIGAYFARFMRGMKMYFTGGNQIPWWLSGVSFYMSSFSAYAFVIYSGLCFRYGLVGVTLFWVFVPATLVGALFFAARWRRTRIDSPVEFLENRYSALVRQLFAWVGLPVGIIDDSLKLIATGTIVHVGMGVPMVQSIVACGVIMVLYTFLGGLWAVTVTDFVQFVILAVAVVVVFPLALAKVGGFGGLVAGSPEGFFNFTNEKYDWPYLILLIGLYVVACSSTHWHLIQKYFCVATEKDARKVGWLVMVLFLIGPPLIFTPAIAARQFLPADMIDKEVYPRLCAALLPVGMLGLIIAAMFSATMANLSSHFNVRASVLTNDIYRRLFRPRAGDRELVHAGRAMTILVGGLTVLIASFLANADAPKLFMVMVTVFGAAVAPQGLPMLVGILTKRVNALGAATALVAGIGLSIVMVMYMPTEGTFYGFHWLRETAMFGISVVFTLAVMFGVSAVTRKSAKEEEGTELFFRRMATPIGQLPEDRHVTEKKPGDKVMSPFRVVGVCVVCIGAMMLCVQPWIKERLPMFLNIGLGVGLICIGGLMAWASKRAAARDAANGDGQ